MNKLFTFPYIIFFNLFMINTLTLFFSDLFNIWFFMEISNFLLISLMSLLMKNKKIIFLFFIIQILTSFLLIFPLILSFFFISMSYSFLMIMASLMLKLSIPPLHFWLPILMKSTPWFILGILSTIQKIIPIFMFSTLNIPSMLIYFIIILTSLIPPFMSLKTYNIKIIMAYSSINQSGWMIILTSFKNIIWLMYLKFYSFIMFSSLLLIYYFKIFMDFNNINMKKFNYLLIFTMMSLGGLPPFSFFFMKWYSMFIFLSNSSLMYCLMLMMISSLIMLSIYINMLINLLFFYKFKLKFIMNYNLNYSYLMFLSIFTIYLSIFILII